MFFINTIKEGIGKAPAEQLKPYFKTLSALVGIKDSLQSWRIDSALVAHLKIIENNTHRKEACDKCVNYLVKLANKNEEAKVWLFKHKEALNDMLADIGYKII